LGGGRREIAVVESSLTLLGGFWIRADNGRRPDAGIPRAGPVGFEDGIDVLAQGLVGAQLVRTGRAQDEQAGE
jgi:hypothetical protein